MEATEEAYHGMKAEMLYFPMTPRHVFTGCYISSMLSILVMKLPGGLKPGTAKGKDRKVYREPDKDEGIWGYCINGTNINYRSI